MKYPRVIIVGTSPFNNFSTARALDAYFHYWDHAKLRQIFSDPNIPEAGHCDELYQITDARLLQCWLGKIKEPGVIYKRCDLVKQDPQNIDKFSRINIINKAYKFGANHSPLSHLLRRLLWRKRFWKTPQLLDWIDSFRPECVFVCSSDDFFILQIALFIAKRFNVPIVSAISDDYYFNYNSSINPLYVWYKKSYMSLCEKFYNVSRNAIYISDKIRDKYNEYFSIQGETVYLVSNIVRRRFQAIDQENPKIRYFGNIRMGRYNSLLMIADALKSINDKYKLEVFSNEKDERIFLPLKSHPNIFYGGSIPYSEVVQKMTDSDIIVIVEGFKKEDIDWSRYSLSTKAADSLASGVSILTYGSDECGIISYMQSTNASVVCTRQKELRSSIEELISNKVLQKTLYDRQIEVYFKNHNIERSSSISYNIICEAIKSYEKEN